MFISPSENKWVHSYSFETALINFIDIFVNEVKTSITRKIIFL